MKLLHVKHNNNNNNNNNKSLYRAYTNCPKRLTIQIVRTKRCVLAASDVYSKISESAKAK